MIKTANEIERYFYQIVKEELSETITGTTYREGQRPDNSDKEDMVVAFLAGTDDQVQKGQVVLNLYVNNIPDNYGRLVPDLGRIGTLESALENLMEDFKGGELYVYREETPHDIAIEGLDQRCIVMRLNYKYLTD